MLCICMSKEMWSRDLMSISAQMKKMQQKIEALEKKLDDKMLGSKTDR